MTNSPRQLAGGWTGNREAALRLHCGCAVRQPLGARKHFSGVLRSPLLEQAAPMLLLAHSARNHCSGVLGSHWALEITAWACFEVT